MNFIDSTFKAVENALQAQVAGTPVSARIVVHAASNADDIPIVLARLIVRAGRWLEGSIDTLFAHGSVQAGQISALVRFRDGQTLLISVGLHRQAQPLVDVTVFGNQGVITGGGQAEFQLSDSLADPQTTSEERQVAQLVRTAQQSRQSVRAVQLAAASSSLARGELAPATFDLHVRRQRHPLRPPYGVLLIAGDHTHQPGYAEALASDPRCQLIGIADEDDVTPARQQLNARLAERLGLRVFPNLAEALDRPDVHIVSVCAEPERRARIIVQAARAGKHLYLDKPLCGSVSQAAEIVQAARGSNGKILAHMFSMVHFDPAVRVREIIASGKLGDLNAIHCDLTFAKGFPGTAQLGRSRQESAEPTQFELPNSKRELTNIGVYSVVAILSLLKRNVRRVFGATENYFFEEHQRADMEDFGQVLMELDGGITATVTAGRTGWKSHPAAGINRVFLVGSKGVACVDAGQPRVTVWSNASSWTPPSRDPDDPMAMWAPLPESPHQARPKLEWFTASAPAWSIDSSHFLDCLQSGHDPEVTIEMAAAATEVLFAAYRSAALRQVVELPMGSV